jgi:hypothetical protein
MKRPRTVLYKRLSCHEYSPCHPVKLIHGNENDDVVLRHDISISPARDSDVDPSDHLGGKVDCKENFRLEGWVRRDPLDLRKEHRVEMEVAISSCVRG